MLRLFRRPLFSAIASLFTATSLLTGCSYDNEEELFGSAQTTTCDVSSVTYSGTIRPLLQQNCYSCHSGQAAQAGVNIADYNTVKLYANIGTLMGVVRHDPGFAPMPKGQAKLSDCDISRLQAWVAAGAPNN